MSEARDPDVPVNLGDERDVRERNRDVKAGNTVTHGVLRSWMGTPTGRKYMFELLDFCQVGGSSFSTNALEMAHREGKRTVGNRILTEIYDACPERYTEMMQEARSVRK
jgi:hypothetical protein